MALINAWYIKNPPWKQINREANNNGQLDPNWEKLEALCRGVLQLRMQFLPYLHAAFVRYHLEGLPPFRALVMDYPDDHQTWTVDDQYMMGESILVAPVLAGKPQRSIYLPEGKWFDYWSGKSYEGKQRIGVDAPLEQIPIFVKGGTLLPLGEIALHTEDPASWRVSVQVYGDGSGSGSLFEDDGGLPPTLTEVRLSWDSVGHRGSVERRGTNPGQKYEVVGWKNFS
jgi:alpha-D-xyloside xylohydrolase